jgi:hypothetical protein
MKKVQFVLAALMFAATGANASILVANDSFNITNVTRTNVNSVKNDNGGDGWAGSWQTQMAAASAPQLVSTTNMEGNTALEFTKDSNQAAFRLLEESIDSDVMVDFQIQVSGTPRYNTFVGLWFGNSDGPSFGLKTDCGVQTGCNQDFFARTTGQGGPFIPNGVVTAGQTYHLFAHLYKSKGGNYDSFDVWLDPTAEEMRYLTTPDLHTYAASGLSSFDTIGFRTVNFASGVSVRVDALNIAVPEPGTLSLMGLSAMGLGFVRRRKSA